MKLPNYTWLILLAFAAASSSVAAEITGKVRDASGDSATVVIDGDAMPAVGDSVEIFFKLAGASEDVLVASGKVAAVEAKVVQVKIENATGMVAKDQVVRIKSAGVAKAPGQSPSRASSPSTKESANPIRGDWTFMAPDGTKVSFSFKEDGTVLWVVEEAQYAKTMIAKYRVDTSATPHVVEIFDLEETEMKGHVLHGIFELQSDGRLKLDLSQEENQAPRFTERETVLMSRATSPIVRPNKPAPPTPTASVAPTPYEAPTPDVASTPSPDEALITEAKQRYDRGDEAGAMEAIEKAIALNPKNASAYFWRGMWIRTKDAPAAIADFEKAMELDPSLKLQELIDAEKVAQKKERTKPTKGPTRAKTKRKP